LRLNCCISRYKGEVPAKTGSAEGTEKESNTAKTSADAVITRQNLLTESFILPSP